MKRKATIKLHVLPNGLAKLACGVTLNVGEAMDKLEPLHTAGGSLDWCSSSTVITETKYVKTL